MHNIHTDLDNTFWCDLYKTINSMFILQVFSQKPQRNLALRSLGMGSSQADHQAGRLCCQAKHITQFEKFCSGKVDLRISAGDKRQESILVSDLSFPVLWWDWSMLVHETRMILNSYILMLFFSELEMVKGERFSCCSWSTSVLWSGTSQHACKSLVLWMSATLGFKWARWAFLLIKSVFGS